MPHRSRLPLLPAETVEWIVGGDWIRDGACADSDYTFDEHPEEFRELCRVCPVARTCLHYGLLTDDRHFILGDSLPQERKVMDNGQRWSLCDTCGRGFLWLKRGRNNVSLCPECHPAGAVAHNYPPTGDTHD